jgi:hypothetical protein
VQDASALIRYLREYHEELRIDPEKKYFYGEVALVALYLFI